MKLVISSDHGGFELKKYIIDYIRQTRKIEVDDLGCYTDASVDYPEFGYLVAKKVAAGAADFGIIICGSGIGISIAANKIKGARAALCHCEEYARLARLHNDANILALGGRFLTTEQATKIVDTFLDTKFEGGRHQRRVDALNLYGQE